MFLTELCLCIHVCENLKSVFKQKKNIILILLFSALKTFVLLMAYGVIGHIGVIAVCPVEKDRRKGQDIATVLQQVL